MTLAATHDGQWLPLSSHGQESSRQASGHAPMQIYRIAPMSKSHWVGTAARTFGDYNGLAAKNTIPLLAIGDGSLAVDGSLATMICLAGVMRRLELGVGFAARLHEF